MKRDSLKRKKKKKIQDVIEFLPILNLLKKKQNLLSANLLAITINHKVSKLKGYKQNFSVNCDISRPYKFLKNIIIFLFQEILDSRN